MNHIYSICLYLSLFVAISVSFVTKATDNLEKLEEAVQAKMLNPERLGYLGSLTLAPFKYPQTLASLPILPRLRLYFEHELVPTKLTMPITQPRPQDKPNGEQNGFLDLKPEVQQIIVKDYLKHNFTPTKIRKEVDIKSKSHIYNIIKCNSDLADSWKKQQQVKRKVDSKAQKVEAQRIAFTIETYLKDKANLYVGDDRRRKRGKEPAVDLSKEGDELDADEDGEFEPARKKSKLDLHPERYTKFSNEDDEGSDN
jgi:hypothetical protein